MYSFCEMEAQALLPPTLTVDKLVITETDSVTLNCQTPSVSVSVCFFRIVSLKPAKSFSCLKTLTGTELLKISHQSSPAEVKVKCFYLQMSQSPDSDTSSIIIRTTVPPQLRVNPSVITETDSVTLNCQTPSSVSVAQCHFYTSSGVNLRHSSCRRSVTGTELLIMSHQGSSADIKVTCFYTVKFGESDSPSPHSDAASIAIHILKPQMSLQHFPGEYVLFTCSLPGSANCDTRCKLYFGEASDPVSTTTIWSKRDPRTNQWFCQFTVTTGDLLSRLRSVQQSDASCDYSLGAGPNSLSSRSDPYSLTNIVEVEPRMSLGIPTFRMTTDVTVGRPVGFTPVKPTSAGRHVGRSDTGSSVSTSIKSVKPTTDPGHTLTAEVIFTSADTTPVNPAFSDEITDKMISMIGAAVTVGVVLLGLVLLFNQSRIETFLSKSFRHSLWQLPRTIRNVYSASSFICTEV
ncbi:uncharacterized protein AB9X84_010047 [Acanthopagrus schlegelii]